MQRELNPVTRKRLFYIAAFLFMDGLVALWLSSNVAPADRIALPAILFGMVQVVIAGAIGSFLFATRKPVTGGRQTTRQ